MNIYNQQKLSGMRGIPVDIASAAGGSGGRGISMKTTEGGGGGTTNATTTTGDEVVISERQFRFLQERLSELETRIAEQEKGFDGLRRDQEAQVESYCNELLAKQAKVFEGKLALASARTKQQLDEAIAEMDRRVSEQWESITQRVALVGNASSPSNTNNTDSSSSNKGNSGTNGAAMDADLDAVPGTGTKEDLRELVSRMSRMEDEVAKMKDAWLDGNGDEGEQLDALADRIHSTLSTADALSSLMAKYFDENQETFESEGV